MLWSKLKPRFEQNQCFCVQTLFYTKSCFTQKLCYPQTLFFTQKPCSCWACARFAAYRIALSMVAGGTRRRRLNTGCQGTEQHKSNGHVRHIQEFPAICELWRHCGPWPNCIMTYYDIKHSCFSWNFLIIWLESHSLFQKTRPQQHCYIKSAQACIMHHASCIMHHASWIIIIIIIIINAPTAHGGIWTRTN